MDLIFVHGAADSGAVWERQVQHFSPAHRALAIDLPGHGDRLAESAFERVEDSADEVFRLAAEHDMSNVVLTGHSMGGAIALTCALRSPNDVRALVLAGSGARHRKHPREMQEARQRADLAPSNAIAKRLIRLDQVVYKASGETQTWLMARFGRATATAVYADFLALDAFDLLGRLSEISQPVLIVAGDRDQWTPPRFQDYLAEHLPNVRLVMLENVGHYPFVEQHARFNAELERFLAQI
jgi:pimeloyl-ACP methyl ester carboxylesterase